MFVTAPRKPDTATVAQRIHDVMCTGNCRCPQTHPNAYAPSARSLLAMAPATARESLHASMCEAAILHSVDEARRGCPAPIEHGERLAAAILRA